MDPEGPAGPFLRITWLVPPRTSSCFPLHRGLVVQRLPGRDRPVPTSQPPPRSAISSENRLSRVGGDDTSLWGQARVTESQAKTRGRSVLQGSRADRFGPGCRTVCSEIQSPPGVRLRTPRSRGTDLIPVLRTGRFLLLLRQPISNVSSATHKKRLCPTTPDLRTPTLQTPQLLERFLPG